MNKKQEMSVELRKIDATNFIDAFNLKLGKGQNAFVSHPVRSLAQAYVYRDQCQPFGIYSGERMIGYVMVIYDHDVPEYDIWHMMIDEAEQGKGYGSAALEAVLAYIKIKPFGSSDRVVLTCSKQNTGAIAMYLKKGFTFTGTDYDDETEMFLTIN